jgi:NitT/TauT family transport system permease protein
MNALAGRQSVAPALASAAGRVVPPLWRTGIAAGAAWLSVAALSAFWADADDYERTMLLSWVACSIGVVVWLAVAADRRWALKRLRAAGPWLIVLALFVAGWEISTAKLDLLPRPFFAAPQSILEVYTDDWVKLGDSTLHSLRLLLTGYAIGAACGFVTGAAIGWSRAAGYWGHPILRFIGPLPATAWLPIAFFVFPSSWSASVFLVALATGFPVAVLTWSGVGSVPSAYYDVARTLGANARFLVLRVAIPAALPSVFVGLFMGLGASFSVLVVAEMMGVKSGLGWYLTWSQGWAAYANMYAALIVMALMCTGLITGLFQIRDRLLSWQKGMLKW